MPKQANTPQITTPVTRKLKRAWHEEFIRLNFDHPEFVYPGDLQKSLIALYLSEPDPTARDKNAIKGRKLFLENWSEKESSVPSTVREKLHAYVTGDPEAIHIDSKSQDRLPRRKRTPKRTR